MIILIKRRCSAAKNRALKPLMRGLLAVKKGLAQETHETKVMLSTYNRFTKGQASKEEMKEANQQFLDVIRGLGLGVLAVLPFAPLTLPFVVKLGEKIGVNVLPSAFITPAIEDEIINSGPVIEVLVEQDGGSPPLNNKP